jgi:hypothetical protein
LTRVAAARAEAWRPSSLAAPCPCRRRLPDKPRRDGNGATATRARRHASTHRPQRGNEHLQNAYLQLLAGLDDPTTPGAPAAVAGSGGGGSHSSGSGSSGAPAAATATAAAAAAERNERRRAEYNAGLSGAPPPQTSAIGGRLAGAGGARTRTPLACGRWLRAAARRGAAGSRRR